MAENLSRDDTLRVNIPIEWLLILATHGNMGTGQIPDIMKRWAKAKLCDAGYKDIYMQCQQEKIRQLTQNLKNVTGEEFTDYSLKAIAFAEKAVQEGMKQLKKENESKR